MTEETFMIDIDRGLYSELGPEGIIALVKDLTYKDEVITCLDEWENGCYYGEVSLIEAIGSINPDEFKVAIIDPNEPGGHVHVVVGRNGISEATLEDYCDEVNGHVRQDDGFTKMHQISFEEQLAESMLYPPPYRDIPAQNAV